MRLILFTVAVLAAGAPARAQTPGASSPGTSGQSAAEDVQTVSPLAGIRFDLPVSVERIREALEKAPDKSLLDGLENFKADYRVEIEEWRRMQDILESIDFSTGPAPAGGLYGYEQQRLLNNPTRNPLGQPYAAFSGGELVTLAVEALAQRLLGGKALEAVSNAARSRAERVAKEQVTRAIMTYCAAQPDRASITICSRTVPPE